MKTSQNGIDLIKKFEGCRLKAYDDGTGTWTIGYGTTEPINGKPIVKGMEITQKQAEELLAKNLTTYERAVDNLGINFNQNQFDALVSFCYNLGTGIFKGTLLQALKNGDNESVANQMLLYNKARINGILTELPGLTKRRKAEASLFLTVDKDEDLEKALQQLAKKGYALETAKWNNLTAINIKNVPHLIQKLGGINNLVSKKIITDKALWESGKYTKNNVRSLLIKAATLI